MFFSNQALESGAFNTRFNTSQTCTALPLCTPQRWLLVLVLLLLLWRVV